LNLYRDNGVYFHPDSAGPNSELPNVPNTCQSYNVYNNDFRTFGTTAGIGSCNVKDLTDVKSITLAANYYLEDSNFSVASTTIQNINIHYTGLPCPDLSGRQSLSTFYGYYCRNIGSLFTTSNNYKFDGCGSLSTLHFYGSGVTGELPRFTNKSLSYLDLRGTVITGGGPSGDNAYVIPEKTFKDAVNLQHCYIQSPYLLENKSIHPNIFAYTPNLYYFWYISYGRTIGSLPSFGNCKSLTWIVAPSNSFDGTSPNFAANLGIYYIDLTYNKFSGAIPVLKNLTSLTYLFLYNNNFTSLSKFQNLPSLYLFYAHNNSLSGEIPDFGECQRLYYLILMNNQFTNYYVGSFAKLYNIKYIDLSGNKLTQLSVNNIIDDLVVNYKTVKRGGVTVNLKSNSLPSGIALEQIAYLRLNGWSIVYE